MVRPGKSIVSFLTAAMTGVLGSSAADPRSSFTKFMGTPKSKTELNPAFNNGAR